MTLSVRSQLDQLLNDENIRIIPHLNRQSHLTNNFIDGQMYNEVSGSNQPLANPDSLSGLFNTDGASTWKGLNGSIWPIQMIINKISPEERFRVENMLLCGLWLVRVSPKVWIFLRPFILELLAWTGNL